MKGKRSPSAKENRRAGIMFLQDAPCDCCDDNTEVAVLDFGIVNTFHWNICKKCLQEFVNQMSTEKEIRKEKLENIEQINTDTITEDLKSTIDEVKEQLSSLEEAGNKLQDMLKKLIE